MIFFKVSCLRRKQRRAAPVIVLVVVMHSFRISLFHFFIFFLFLMKCFSFVAFEKYLRQVGDHTLALKKQQHHYFACPSILLCKFYFLFNIDLLLWNWNKTKQKINIEKKTQRRAVVTQQKCRRLSCHNTQPTINKFSAMKSWAKSFKSISLKFLDLPINLRRKNLFPVNRKLVSLLKVERLWKKSVCSWLCQTVILCYCCLTWKVPNLVPSLSSITEFSPEILLSNCLYSFFTNRLSY